MPYFVYFMANESFTIYIGVTNDLQRRVLEHRQAVSPTSFTARHSLAKLVYFEYTENVIAAISREKQLKGWRRSRKVALVQSANPNWLDLAADWNEDPDISAPSLRSG